MRKILLATVLVFILVMATSTIALAGPNVHKDYKVHYVAYGESLLSIAIKYGVTVEAIAYQNNLADADVIYVGQKLIIPVKNVYYSSGCGKYHTVQGGETLSGIAWYYGISVDALSSLNGLYNEDIIYAGAKLCVSVKDTYEHKPPVHKEPYKHKDKGHKPKPDYHDKDEPYDKAYQSHKSDYAYKIDPDKVYLRLGRNVVYEYWGRPEYGLDDCTLDWYDDSQPVKRLTVEVLLTNKSDYVISGDWAAPSNVVFHLASGGYRYPCIHRYGYGQQPKPDGHYLKPDYHSYPGNTKPYETVDVTFYTHIEKTDLVLIIEFTKLGLCFDVNSGDKIYCPDYGYGGY